MLPVIIANALITECLKSLKQIGILKMKKFEVRYTLEDDEYILHEEEVMYAKNKDQVRKEIKRIYTNPKIKSIVCVGS